MRHLRPKRSALPSWATSCWVLVVGLEPYNFTLKGWCANLYTIPTLTLLLRRIDLSWKVEAIWCPFTSKGWLRTESGVFVWLPSGGTLIAKLVSRVGFEPTYSKGVCYILPSQEILVHASTNASILDQQLIENYFYSLRHTLESFSSTSPRVITPS